MTQAQKIIKYLAVAFAISLVIAIIYTISMGLYSITSIFKENDSNKENMNIVNCKNITNISYLDIELNNSNLIIKESDNFKIESNTNKISCNQNNEAIKIKENSNTLEKINSKDLIIYLPKDIVLSKMEIEIGIGKINIYGLETQKLNLELGLGNITIKESKINNLDLNQGIGKIDITSILNGFNKIETGIGVTNINLIGTESDYKIEIEKGIGPVKVNDINVSDNEIAGTGLNLIKIETGIGSTKVNIK